VLPPTLRPENLRNQEIAVTQTSENQNKDFGQLCKSEAFLHLVVKITGNPPYCIGREFFADFAALAYPSEKPPASSQIYCNKKAPM
jgi:hypothetical protein